MKKPPTKKKEIVERPAYVRPDGTLDLEKIFKFQVKQMELLRNVSRNGRVYLQPAAHQCLSVGGIRGGKTLGVLMYFAIYYCLQFNGCNILVLRRTFKELENGAISDFKTFMPKELYTYNPTTHVAEFYNGSKVIFGHCVNNKERDLDQYLGQAYTAILIDEVGQFSPDAWHRLYSRNIVNPACQPDEAGTLPLPCIWGCTNPIGPHYEFYRTSFVQGEPWEAPEDAKKDLDGRWWAPEAGDWRLIYDPEEFSYQRTTVMDNPALLERDPGIIARLNSMPKAKRDKMLLGLDGRFEGQYYDVWDESYHVVNLREEPEAIIWQPHQRCWAGQDWGIGHANAAYLFTRALVRSSIGDDYRSKVVCFKEVVVTGGKTGDELAALLKRACVLPNGVPVELSAIYFSHEKFSKQISGRTPADEYSRSLRAVGLPAVTRATQDRIGRASLVYNMLKKGDLVVLDNCREIILAMPSLMRDPDNLDDVLKTETKGDDCYDGFAYGIYGQLANRKTPARQLVEDYAKRLEKENPVAAHFYRLKLALEHENENAPFKQQERPMWMNKMES